MNVDKYLRFIEEAPYFEGRWTFVMEDGDLYPSVYTKFSHAEKACIAYYEEVTSS
jgi:hypothetical protein